MKQLRIVILPGHNIHGVNGKYDPGAFNPDLKIYEGEKTIIFRDKVIETFHTKAKDVFEIITFEGSLGYKTKVINNLDPQPLFAIELHFNASPTRKARGHEILKSLNKESAILAKCIDDRFDKIPYIVDRGEPLVGYFRQDPKKPLVWFLRKTNCPAVIVEPIFIDNNDDAKLLTRDEFWKDISEAVFYGVRDYLLTYKFKSVSSLIYSDLKEIHNKLMSDDG